MNSLSYYETLAQYLYSLLSQTSSLSLSSEEAIYLKNAILKLYNLTLVQIEEIQCYGS